MPKSQVQAPDLPDLSRNGQPHRLSTGAKGGERWFRCLSRRYERPSEVCVRPLHAAVLKSLIQLLVPLCLGVTTACAQPTLDDLWEGRARFEQVGELNYGALHADGVPKAAAGWYTASVGRWYAFSRSVVVDRSAHCPLDHTEVIVSESRDKGRTWSTPVVAASPGASAAGDGCAILDGSTFYEQSSGIWHLLAQCLDRDQRGGWSLCHYTRRAESPLGRFVADPTNPVVRSGQLWHSICAGARKSCPLSVVDEGTPDIVENHNGLFIVTLHGFDGKNGYRTVVATPDFRTWSVAGEGLPNDAILTAAECSAWLAGCVGFGQATAVRSGNHIYMVAEAMDRSLLCQEDQTWTFALLRSKKRAWPRSGQKEWELFRPEPLLRPSNPDPKTRCQVAYARWLVNGADTYLIYEDWEPKHKRLHRRLLKLVAGAGPPLTLR